MYAKNAFGNPDGSRSEISDMMANFIEFNEKFTSSGIASHDDMQTRVIIGAKGSGKTVYLRRLQVLLQDNPSVHVSEIEQELPSTDLIINFCQQFHHDALTEKWMALWKCAILRALVSHILYSEDLSNNLLEEEISNLSKFDNILYPKFNYAMHVYSEARNILSFYKTRNQINDYFNKREWDELDAVLSSLLKKLPPIYFFIDSVDEEYAHAPMYWLRCQKGLFYRVMRLFRENKYGNKLHVVICVRDHVLASVNKSEHQTRYKNEEHIKILKWNYKSIKYFFEAKISALNDCYLFDKNNKRNIYSWLGITSIENKVRGISEPVEQYILRHTRMLPRDVVIIGNSLSELMLESTMDNGFDIHAAIRKHVAKDARTFGSELIKICANQIINDDMPKEAGRFDFSEVYTSINEYTESIDTKIREVISHIGTDRFTWDELLKADEYAKSILDGRSNLFTVLWQNGAMGYIENGPNGTDETFFVDGDFEDFLLPTKKSQYILRSCIIDAIGHENYTPSEHPVIGGNIL